MLQIVKIHNRVRLMRQAIDSGETGAISATHSLFMFREKSFIIAIADARKRVARNSLSCRRPDDF